MTTRRATTFLLGAATVGLLAACATGRSVEGTRAPATTLTATSSQPAPVDDPTSSVPRFPSGRAPQTAKQSGAWDLVFTDVHVVEHAGFDRIVLGFKGSGTPGWAVNYVRKAVLDGSGKHVRLDGDAFLDIYASGTTWPAPGYYDGPRQFEPENAGRVEDVHVGGTFEGYTQVLVGIGGDPAPFRTFALSSPPRLVVDIADDNTS